MGDISSALKPKTKLNFFFLFIYLFRTLGSAPGLFGSSKFRIACAQDPRAMGIIPADYQAQREHHLYYKLT